MWLKHYSLTDSEQKLVNMSNEDFVKYMAEHYSEMFSGGMNSETSLNFCFDIGPGWRHILDSLCSELKTLQILSGVVCVFQQIKEKFGSARFYYTLDSSNMIIDVPESLIDIIEDLVSSHEEYSNYVCEELGVNVDESQKIRLGSWRYGSGIKGFEKAVRTSFPNNYENKVNIAKAYIEKIEKRQSINDKMHNFSIEELNSLYNIAETISQKK